VTLAWVPFRAESFAEAQRMFSYLFPNASDPLGPRSFDRFWSAQFHGSSLITWNEWFKPHELWPSVLPPDFLSTTLRPVGLVLLILGLATFLMPNTYQIFRRFHPALNLPDEPEMSQGALADLGWRVAFVLAGAFIVSVLGLSHVSPFLYFRF
jgi:hypothetical protein